MGHWTKTDEFLEKFQTAFDPSPLILERKALIVHTVCANFGLNVHTVCTNFGFTFDI